MSQEKLTLEHLANTAFLSEFGSSHQVKNVRCFERFY